MANGPWNKWDFQPGYGNYNPMFTIPGCMQAASWYGWNYPGDSSISTTLHGNGKAVLEFGNCNSGGKVVALINDEEISCVGPGTYNVTFEFQDGDELKISESGDESYAIMHFNGLKFISCSSGKKLLTIHLGAI